MAVPYNQFVDDIISAEDDIISSASEDNASIEHTESRLIFRGHEEHNSLAGRGNDVLTNKWPKQTGLLHITWGIVVLVLGLAQVLVVPMIEDNTSKFWIPHLNKSNFYGITIWTGILLLLSGTLGLKSAMYKNMCNLYAFVTVIMFEVVVFLVSTLVILVAFSAHWVTKTTFPEGSRMFAVTVSAALTVLVGFLFVILAFTQYYEEVFCGEVQLCRRCIHGCLPCWCPKAVSLHEPLEECDDTRPPSLPI